MSWQDRDYAKEPQFPGRGFATPFGRFRPPRSLAITLIWVNAIIYALCIFTAGPGNHLAQSTLFRLGVMEPNAVLHGQVWRLFTSDYLHWSGGHILFNMIGLYFLGPPLEQVWGRRKFFAVYALSGIIGSACYLLLSQVWLGGGLAAGASGCVLGLLGAAAVLFPSAKVLIYFLFPINIRTLAVVLGGMYVLNIFSNGPNAGGDACHIAGLIFGAWWAMKGDAWWSRRGSHSPRINGSDGFRQFIQQRREDARTVDRILDKVRNDGLDSLTDHEKKSLAEATRRQQQAERQYDRVDRV